MTTISIKGTEYKIYFSYNSFCDGDLLDRAADILKLVQNNNGEKSEEENVAIIKKMFVVTRDLLLEGFKKFNPVADKNAVGDLLDDYFSEGTDDDPHGITEIFNIVAGELVAEGFFGQFLKDGMKMKRMTAPIPKKKATKKS